MVIWIAMRDPSTFSESLSYISSDAESDGKKIWKTTKKYYPQHFRFQRNSPLISKMEKTEELPPEELMGLKRELISLQSEIREMDISSNRREFVRHSISDEDMEKHRRLGDRIREIQSIMTSQKKHGVRRMQEDQVFVDLLKETFGQGDYIKLMQEYNRRRKGETYIRVSMGYKDSNAPIYKKKLIDLYDSMKVIRQTLTEVNMKGCEQFNMSDFMKIISPLNRIVPPLGEIEKLKKQI